MNATFNFFKNEKGWNFNIMAINKGLNLVLTDKFTTTNKATGLKMLRNKINAIKKLPG